MFIVRMFFICMISLSVSAQSLYSDRSYSPLHSDQRNLQKGSIVTVLIYEQASASTSAGSETERDTGLSASIRGTDPLSTESGSIDLSSTFEGNGSTSRQGRLIASVSVSVQEIYDNGEILIKGKQLIEFNEEKQHIELQGRIRADDVSAENTILSTRIADAHIVYVGDGLLGRQQKPGILSRVLGWVF